MRWRMRSAETSDVCARVLTRHKNQFWVQSRFESWIRRMPACQHASIADGVQDGERDVCLTHVLLVDSFVIPEPLIRMSTSQEEVSKEWNAMAGESVWCNEVLCRAIRFAFRILHVWVNAPFNSIPSLLLRRMGWSCVFLPRCFWNYFVETNWLDRNKISHSLGLWLWDGIIGRETSK
jgi:hypothetical protein